MDDEKKPTFCPPYKLKYVQCRFPTPPSLLSFAESNPIIKHSAHATLYIQPLRKIKFTHFFLIVIRASPKQS